MLSFGSVAAVNDILALKATNNLLITYPIQNKTTWWTRWLMKKAREWVDFQAKRTFVELRGLLRGDQVTLGLKDCDSGLFTVLYLAQDKRFTPKTGEELFATISTTQLEFEKIKRPREEIKIG